MDVCRATWGDTFSAIPRAFSGVWEHVYDHETNAIHSAVSMHQACGARPSAGPEDTWRSRTTSQGSPEEAVLMPSALQGPLQSLET